ncbi:MAG: ribonuclease PH [Chloroflexota bacterium]
MIRHDGRPPDQLRPITFETHFTHWAEGSVLAKFGHTHVLCNVSIENELPAWLRNKPEAQGWLTAEYALLPRSTLQRTPREQRWPKGRTQEIARLIGRSLRMAVDLKALGPRQITVDCDVLQADGGTRTAAITGGWLALKLALQPLIAAGEVAAATLTRQIAAVSVGLVNGVALLDLDYYEDAAAGVDCNVVMTADGEFVEVQATAEASPFTHSQFNELLQLAGRGIQQLLEKQVAAAGL